MVTVVSAILAIEVDFEAAMRAANAAAAVALKLRQRDALVAEQRAHTEGGEIVGAERNGLG